MKIGRNTKRNEIKREAVRDFYGKVRNSNFKAVMEYLIKGQYRIPKQKITKEQADDVWHIKQNLSDPVYRKEIEKDLKGSFKS